jgi:hypothetical protein
LGGGGFLQIPFWSKKSPRARYQIDSIAKIVKKRDFLEKPHAREKKRDFGSRRIQKRAQQGPHRPKTRKKAQKKVKFREKNVGFLKKSEIPEKN